MIAQERIETNQLLMEMVGLDLTSKSLTDNLQAERYYTLLSEHIESQIQSAINWIDSDSAREFFFNDAYHQAEIWDSLEDDWDNILSSKYETIDDLLEEVYDYGKSRGYSDMAETLRYTPTDRLAFAFARNYNYGLIQNLDNDLRGAIKDRMTQAAIQGENPYSLAPHLRKLGLTQLPGSTFTPYQRAVLIARTETSRIQNTGILQSYVNEGYTRVKILTACDDNVCTICLRYAFEFNSSDKVTFENRGEERTHNIRDLLKGGSYPPFHPLCRCTYLSVWESKGPVPDEPYVVNLTEYSGARLSGLFDSYLTDENASETTVRLPELNVDKFKTKIQNFVGDENKVNEITYLLKSFIDDVVNVNVEFGAIGFGGNNRVGFVDWNRKNVKLPEDLEKYGMEHNLPILIHNHPYSTSPFPSPDDFETFAKCGVKYGLVTNDIGTFIVKNPEYKTNKNNVVDIQSSMQDIVDNMLEDFEIKYSREFNDKNHVDLSDMNKLVNNNSNKYFNQYSKNLEEYGMKVIFINNE